MIWRAGERLERQRLQPARASASEDSLHRRIDAVVADHNEPRAQSSVVPFLGGNEDGHARLEIRWRRRAEGDDRNAIGIAIFFSLPPL